MGIASIRTSTPLRANSSETATISGPPAANSASRSGRAPVRDRIDAVVDDPGPVARSDPLGDPALGLADAEDAGRERHQRPLDPLVGERPTALRPRPSSNA